jgi:antitoxin (DNA-binding transcriptional repressor) of toxin-antitoxin stability system
MTVVTIHQAKTNLSKLLKLVEAGEEVIIARGDKKIARIVAEPKPQPKSRGYGAWKHLAGKIPDSVFFDPLPDEELDAWEGKYGPDP